MTRLSTGPVGRASERRGGVALLREALERVAPVACQTTDAEAWSPDHTDAHRLGAAMAVDAGRRCEAAGPCLAYALAADHRQGIWGGTLPVERQAMRREADADG